MRVAPFVLSTPIVLLRYKDLEAQDQALSSNMSPPLLILLKILNAALEIRRKDIRTQCDASTLLKHTCIVAAVKELTARESRLELSMTGTPWSTPGGSIKLSSCRMFGRLEQDCDIKLMT